MSNLAVSRQWTLSAPESHPNGAHGLAKATVSPLVFADINAQDGALRPLDLGQEHAAAVLAGAQPLAAVLCGAIVLVELSAGEEGGSVGATAGGRVGSGSGRGGGRGGERGGRRRGGSRGGERSGGWRGGCRGGRRGGRRGAVPERFLLFAVEIPARGLLYPVHRHLVGALAVAAADAIAVRVLDVERVLGIGEAFLFGVELVLLGIATAAEDFVASALVRERPRRLGGVVVCRDLHHDLGQLARGGRGCGGRRRGRRRRALAAYRGGEGHGAFVNVDDFGGVLEVAGNGVGSFPLGEQARGDAGNVGAR